MKCIYGLVRYVEDISEIPQSPKTRYIIRERIRDVVLEKTNNKESIILEEFDPLSLTNDRLRETLIKARGIINANNILWVCRCSTP